MHDHKWIESRIFRLTENVSFSLPPSLPLLPPYPTPTPRENAAETAIPEAQYLAVPIFDLKGKVCAFIAVDNLRMPPGDEQDDERFSPNAEQEQPPDLTEPWRISLLQSVSEAVGRALAMNKGLAEDFEEMNGPVSYAKKAVEIIAGRSSSDMIQEDEPPFLKRFPLLSDLACRGYNVFGSYTVELPRKRCPKPQTPNPKPQTPNTRP